MAASTKKFKVINVGASYKTTDDPPRDLFATNSEVIDLDSTQAERLQGLGAVAPATDADIEAHEQRVAAATAFLAPGSNPYGGTPLQSLEEHALESGDYDSQTVEVLQAEADRRDLTVEGTGSDGNVLKGDLVAALEAHDQSKK